MPPPGLPPTAATRLQPPELRPEAIARDRVVRTLAAAAERPLTFVSAPAGFGKTTAIVQWLDGWDGANAWLSLHPSDNDPRWFAARLLAALERGLPGRFEEAERAFQGGSDLEQTVIPLIANALADPPPPSLALVLDDYHEVTEPTCHRQTRALVDSLPGAGAVTVVIASRSLPPLRLGRRRAAGAVAEIGAGDLRFARSEADQLLNGPLGLGLSEDEVSLLDERLGGWAAGLALVGSALASRRDRDGFREALERSRESLESYLAEEVLDEVGHELAVFLQRVAVLTELSAPLCAAVTGEERAAELLEEARRMNLFVTALDRGGEWFRFHDVFATMLRGELRRREPERLAELHCRAAAWYEGAGRTEEALDHALQAGDGARAGALLAASWIGLIGERRHVTLRRLLDRMPAERGGFGPLCEALDLLCMIYEGVDQRITAERATRLAAAHGDDLNARLVLDGILISPFYGEVDAAVAVGRSAWERYGELPGAREQLVGPLALALWFAGEHAEVRALLEPRVLLEQPTFIKVWTLGILALTAADEGDGPKAERLARAAAAEVDAAGAETATEFAGLPWVLATALRANGKLSEAREQMHRGLANEERRPGSVGHAVALVFDAQLALAEGDRDRARTTAQRAGELVDRYPDLGTFPARLAAIEAALARDRNLLGSDPSAAELRVLSLLDSPRSLAEIATELYVSRETVKSHTRRLYRRLGVNTRAEAVKAARRRGLLPNSRAQRI